MLLVRTKIASSTIHGIGLFAAEFIAENTEVWRFLKGFDLEKTKGEIQSLPLHIQEQLKHYGYFDFHIQLHILCFDDARFINHSDTPNLKPDYRLDPYGTDRAVRDILPGEELTVDYRLIEEAEEKSY